MKNFISTKYFIVNDQDPSWGTVVNTVGFQKILPNSEYPLKNHPVRYLFSTQKGRVLDEYQLLYISEGKGIFETTGLKEETEVQGGNFMLLFPGEWHNYRPYSETGWTEYWIGFEGSHIDERVQAGFFSKNHPVFYAGINEEIIHLYNLAIKIGMKQNAGYQQILSGIVSMLLGYAYGENKQNFFENLKIADQMENAVALIRENYNKDISIHQIAKQAHLSYSAFRKLFKEYTGFPPHQYVLELKIQKSKELLTNTAMTSQEIAYETGFETANEFCISFKKRTTQTPIQYRNFHQGTFIKNKSLFEKNTGNE